MQRKDQLSDGLPAILYNRDLYFSIFMQLLKCSKPFIHTEEMSHIGYSSFFYFLVIGLTFIFK